VRPTSNTTKLLLQLTLVTVGLLFIASQAIAQTMQPPGLSTSRGVQPITSEPASQTSIQSNTDPVEPISPSVRRFHYSLNINIAEVYDDNVTLAPQGFERDDLYTRIAAMLTLGFGDTVSRDENFLLFAYEPALFIFADNSDLNAAQHVIRLEGGYRFNKLKLTLSEDIQLLETADAQLPTFTGTIVNGANIDTGTQRGIKTYNTTLTGSYELTGKTFLTSTVDYHVTDYGGPFLDSERASANLFLNYRYGDKLVIGAGGVIGRDFVDPPSSEQTFEQFNLRATYNVTGKLTANGSGGVEFRQFEGSASDYISPVFDLGLDYTPFGGTTIGVSASRKTLTSGSFIGQDYASTHFQVTARQRLLRRFTLSLTAGYQNLDYVDAGGVAPAVREDNYYFIQPAIDVRITNFWFAGTFFVHRENTSNFSIFSFDDNQAGIRTTLNF
jgi:Putative beta-barrel porin 2